MALTEDSFRMTNKGVVLPIAFVGVLAGGIWYAATQNAAVQNLAIQVEQLRTDVKDRNVTNGSIDRRLAKVETMLETMLHRTEKPKKAGDE